MSEVKAVYIDHGKVIGGSAASLDNLIDVDITNVSASQVLGYDSTSSKWVNQTVPSPEGKADKVDGATNGDLAALDSNGNLTDSGVSADDFLTVISNSTSGNIPVIGSNGQLEDSGISLNDFLTVVSSAINGNLAAFTSDGKIQDSGVSANDIASSQDLSTLQTALWGNIPVNPDNTAGMTIWIET